MKKGYKFFLLFLLMSMSVFPKVKKEKVKETTFTINGVKALKKAPKLDNGNGKGNRIYEITGFSLEDDIFTITFKGKKNAKTVYVYKNMSDTAIKVSDYTYNLTSEIDQDVY